MSNRSSSKQHGMHRIKRMQPTKKQSKRNNKAGNRARQITRQMSIIEALKAAIAGLTKTKPAKKAAAKKAAAKTTA